MAYFFYTITDDGDLNDIYEFKSLEDVDCINHYVSQACYFFTFEQIKRFSLKQFLHYSPLNFTTEFYF